MRKRWRVILPFIGLVLFAGESYESLQSYRQYHKGQSPDFYWASIRLNSDPLHRHGQDAPGCTEGQANCVGWDPVTPWIERGVLADCLVLSALPVFLVEAFVVSGLGRLGISQISTFMATMPFLLFGWYYGVGWQIDRWLFRRACRRSTSS